MEDFSFEGDWSRLDIFCPRCGSNNVLISFDEYGYYRITECKKCNYKYNFPEISH